MPPRREPFEESSGTSIRGLEAELIAVRNQSETLKQLRNVELFVRKLNAKAGGRAAGLSTYSSACTSACFSSASTICAKGAITVAAKDPEIAEVFATLHRRGIETLGEEGFMDAMLAEAKKVKAVSIVELAEEREQ
jgi:hypothetical protein